MNIRDDIDKPIFVQIAEGIEEAILSKTFAEESQIPSITEFSVMYKINPATALKGINILVDNGIIYKKRGIGMFVCQGAVHKLKEKRKNQFFDNFISNMVSEAKKIGITKEDIINMIEKEYDNGKNWVKRY